jgi:hypothetical protein
MKLFVFSALIAVSSFGGAIPPRKQHLFNGKNLSGWYVFLEKRQKNEDPARVFTVEDGTLHVSGKEFGYLCTEKAYRNYHLTVEFKWGTHRYAPRDTAKRDNGIMYNIPLNTEDRVWPAGIECQIQEGDVGDFWLVGGTTIMVDGKRNTPGPWVRMAKKRDAEKPTGEWNRVEVISKDGICTHIVNGVIVARGTNASVREGKILLQTEGAEAYFRRVDLEELTP